LTYLTPLALEQRKGEQGKGKGYFFRQEKGKGFEIKLRISVTADNRVLRLAPKGYALFKIGML